MTCCCSFFRSCLDIVYVHHEQTCFEMFLLKRKFCLHCCSQKSTMITNKNAVLGCTQEPSWRDECKEKLDSKKYRSDRWKQNLEMNEKRSLFKNIEEIYWVTAAGDRAARGARTWIQPAQSCFSPGTSEESHMGWKQTVNQSPRVWRKGGDDESQAAGVTVWSFHSVMVWTNCFIWSGDVGAL